MALGFNPIPAARAYPSSSTQLAQANSADIAGAMRQILRGSLPKLAQPIGVRELDSRLSTQDAVRAQLLSRIAAAASRQIGQTSWYGNLAAIIGGGGDRVGRLQDIANQAVQRRDRLFSADDLKPHALPGIRNQIDAFIRTHLGLIDAR